MTLSDVIDACNKQKRGKAPGPEGIAMESVIYGVLAYAFICVCCLTCLSGMVICPLLLCSRL